jgi:hypothetical protein
LIDRKFKVVIIGVILIFSYVYLYLPLLFDKHTKTRELILVYALHDLKEIQTETVLDIENKTFIGGDRQFYIKVKGDMYHIFNKQEMIANGWRDVTEGGNYMRGYKKDYVAKISQGNGYYEICISAILGDEER